MLLSVTEIDRPLKVIVLAPPSYVPATLLASGPLIRKVTLANGPVPEVCTTTCDTASGSLSPEPPSSSLKSKISTAEPAAFAVDGRWIGSLTPPSGIRIPSLSGVTTVTRSPSPALTATPISPLLVSTALTAAPSLKT